MLQYLRMMAHLLLQDLIIGMSIVWTLVISQIGE